MCVECGKHPSMPGIISCQKCRDRKRKYSKDKRIIALNNGTCSILGCSNPLFTKAVCKSCLENNHKQQGQRVERLRAAGLCFVCGKLIATPCGRCEKCQLKYLARFYLGDRKQWEILKELYKKQNGRCAYTNIPITIGNTASIDHIVPKSKGGQNIISNYQWTHCWINLAKKTTIHEEFILKLKEFIEQLKDATLMLGESVDTSNPQL